MSVSTSSYSFSSSSKRMSNGNRFRSASEESAEKPKADIWKKDIHFYNIPYSSGNGVKVIDSETNMFKDVRESLAKTKSGRLLRLQKIEVKRKPSFSMETVASLKAIDEELEETNKDGDHYLKEKKVRIISMFVAHDGDGCATFVSNKLHNAITHHDKFTSVANFQQVLQDAFEQVDKEFVNYKKLALDDSAGDQELDDVVDEYDINARDCTSSNTVDFEDESGCSVITILICGKDVVAASVGNIQGMLLTEDDQIVEVVSEHIISKSKREFQRLLQAGITFSKDGKTIVGTNITYSRAFGHRNIKKAFPGSIVTQPRITGVQINLRADADDENVQNQQGNDVAQQQQLLQQNAPSRQYHRVPPSFTQVPITDDAAPKKSRRTLSLDSILPSVLGLSCAAEPLGASDANSNSNMLNASSSSTGASSKPTHVRSSSGMNGKDSSKFFRAHRRLASDSQCLLAHKSRFMSSFILFGTSNTFKVVSKEKLCASIKKIILEDGKITQETLQNLLDSIIKPHIQRTRSRSSSSSSVDSVSSRFMGRFRAPSSPSSSSYVSNVPDDYGLCALCWSKEPM